MTSSLAVLPACDGDKGDPGNPGNPGDPGDPGNPGAACWDVDANGTCDVADEDLDGDGSCTVADCAGVSTTVLSGTVTNGVTDAAIADAVIVIDPVIPGVDITTDASGDFSVILPIGIYEIAIEVANFAVYEQTVALVADTPAVLDIGLTPVTGVIVDAGGSLTGDFDGDLTLDVTVEILDGSTIESYAWTQLHGAVAGLSGDTTASATASLAALADYRDELVSHLARLERYNVQGIDPYALEEAQLATFEIAVKTTSGTYTDTVDVHVHMPYVVSTGIANVAVDTPVLLNGKTQDSYTWALTAPSGSSAALDSATIRNPSFTPDVAGTYTVTEASGSASFDVVAGSWTGAISAIGADGMPNSTACTGCHNGGFAPDMFTAWRQTGHAEIFSANVNTSTHYGDGCFACHTVGFGSGGIDSADDYSAFMAADIINNPSPDNWSDVVTDFSDTAGFANIQCENCHGPNDSALHNDTTTGGERVSLASEVCGSCHGEPMRHARFQQWSMSGHGSYELPVSRGTSTSCARCHSGQGFLAWLPRLEAGLAGSLDAGDVVWSAETVHAVTCATCHDPHAIGKTSGEPNDAQMRVSGDTPMLPAGFTAYGVGRGAICVTCHNTRNGERNDYTYASALMDDRAPHTAAQGDVMMGENAFFVSPGKRGGHSFIQDTCTNCHMVLSQPPAALSYNRSGTNHTFKASMEICSDCHGEFDGEGLKSAVVAKMHALELEIEKAIEAEIVALVGGGHTVTVSGVDSSDAAVSVTINSGNVGDISSIVLSESHGRAAMDITVGATEVLHVRLNSDTEVDASGFGILQSAAATNGQTIAKAAWNFFLVEGDGSHGIHNPDFAMEVLDASMRQLR